MTNPLPFGSTNEGFLTLYKDSKLTAIIYVYQGRFVEQYNPLSSVDFYIYTSAYTVFSVLIIRCISPITTISSSFSLYALLQGDMYKEFWYNLGTLKVTLHSTDLAFELTVLH